MPHLSPSRLKGLTKSLALELAPLGAEMAAIPVNPGNANTALLQGEECGACMHCLALTFMRSRTALRLVWQGCRHQSCHARAVGRAFHAVFDELRQRAQRAVAYLPGCASYARGPLQNHRQAELGMRVRAAAAIRWGAPLEAALWQWGLLRTSVFYACWIIHPPASGC